MSIDSKIITICGSMTFFEQMMAMQEKLENRGYKVFVEV